MMALLSGCRSQAQPDAITTASVAAPVRPSSFIPKAVAYRTNGNYAANVPVTLADSGNELASFPAPSDLTESSTPVPLADGYLLDRRGISSHTAFLRYTYDEYRALPEVPGIAQLKSAIIPDARVTEIVQLPVTVQKACADTAAVNNMIREKSPELKILYKAGD